MASPYHLPVTAAQVGTYFVGQYYQMLQTQPDLVHQLYSDRSTVLRIDGLTRETATAMLQIHALVMSLNYTAVEIKSAHSLESWDRGILVLVSGSVHLKDYNGKRKFVQTFFLAPQEKGYFVLNDIFHFIEEEPIYQHPFPYLTQNNLDSKLNASTGTQEQAANYLSSGDVQTREYIAPPSDERNGTVDAYSFQDKQLEQVSEAENIVQDSFAVESNGSLHSSVNPVQDHSSSPAEEAVGEPQKHTYASILQVTKAQSAPSVPQHHINKSTLPTPEWNQATEHPEQRSFTSTDAERSGAEAAEDISAADDEVETKSVYVKNVPPTVSASEIEEEFRKFGKLKNDGVAIRTRKDLGVCYAFVEFEDIAGVQNAIKASTVEIAGHQVYIEGRRPNRSTPYRGGRGRGRGRVGYQMDGRSGRVNGRSYGRGSVREGSDRDYNRSRSNGYYRQGNRQERLNSSSQQLSGNGHSPSD